MQSALDNAERRDAFSLGRSPSFGAARTHLVSSSVKWLILAALLGIGGYHMAIAPVAVTAHKVAIGPVAAEVMGMGTLNTHFKAAASPKSFQGRLLRVFVDQNDFVTNGQLLAQLDDCEQRRQVEAAQATLNASEAAAHRVQADEARAQANLKLAELNHQRQSALLQAKIISQEEFEGAEAKLETAQSGLTVAKLAIAEAEQQRLVAEKQLGYQKELLADTLICAPFNGLVIKRNHDPGDVVAPGTSILDLADTNEIWVSAGVDEAAMAPLQTNAPARVVFRSEPATAYPGRIARLGRKTDPETREFVVDVKLDKPPANWTIGQRAEVYIETSRSTNAVVLPITYLAWREGQPGVLVNQREWARWRDVKLGLRGRDVVEVASGLALAEQVVAPADGKLTSALADRRIKVLSTSPSLDPLETP
jgi:HlyD family secretion protein